MVSATSLKLISQTVEFTVNSIGNYKPNFYIDGSSKDEYDICILCQYHVVIMTIIIINSHIITNSDGIIIYETYPSN